MSVHKTSLKHRRSSFSTTLQRNVPQKPLCYTNDTIHLLPAQVVSVFTFSRWVCSTKMEPSTLKTPGLKPVASGWPPPNTHTPFTQPCSRPQSHTSVVFTLTHKHCRQSREILWQYFVLSITSLVQTFLLKSLFTLSDFCGPKMRSLFYTLMCLTSK